MLRPDVFAAVLGLARTASKIGACWVQNDFCVRVKGASDDWPDTYEDPATSMEQVRDLLEQRLARELKDEPVAV